MEPALLSPAKATILGMPAVIFSVLIPVIAAALFTYIIAIRLAPIVKAAPDFRFNRLMERFGLMMKYAMAQYRQPRYFREGIVHILIFAGFVIISLHSVTLVMVGIKDGFQLPFMSGTFGHVYAGLKDIAATLVLISCIIAIFRRLDPPERFKVPPKYGKDHTAEAIFVLVMISGLMLSDSFFEGSLAAAQMKKGLQAEFLIPGTLVWFTANLLDFASIKTLQTLHIRSYFTHELIFFTFLNFLPLGKHFHVFTSLPNVFFMKLDKGTVKPVRWGVTEDKVEELASFGVKKAEDFTWKHILDFYSCADCGRCSDQCPANAVKRPLSPRFISIKCRDYIYKNYPFKGGFLKSEPLIGNILEEDEIWSCTTCGACEAECPLMIEYIDKIVDLRRGMVDDGLVPQSLQKPLSALEKRGNPYGKMEKKRGDWTKDLSEEFEVRVLDGKRSAETLFFADSITSYDDRIQDIGRAAARVLRNSGVHFGILGAAEKDSGNDVRRFGEEMLYMELKRHNTEMIKKSGAKRIVTADPHAFNTLKNEYSGIPPVEHISQAMARLIRAGKLKLNPLEDKDAVCVYHDPCYLGRHNGVYDAPREVLDAIPNLRRAEMTRSRDRSFCCGGGGLMLFYEPVEETRMGRLRVEMAKEAGATVIVTACPFCMVNMEDAIKTSGMEGKMVAVDLVELVARQMA